MYMSLVYKKFKTTMLTGCSQIWLTEQLLVHMVGHQTLFLLKLKASDWYERYWTSRVADFYFKAPFDVATIWGWCLQRSARTHVLSANLLLLQQLSRKYWWSGKYFNIKQSAKTDHTTIENRSNEKQNIHRTLSLFSSSAYKLKRCLLWQYKLFSLSVSV